MNETAALDEPALAGPSSIRILPQELTSRIAAGEVIERPASVVKELAENALDAGARRIHVEIAEGGKKLIRVTDDGFGMSPADLVLAVQPHATSKLSAAEDLLELTTLGFRGEALPSIAAICHFSITSRQRVPGSGFRVPSSSLITHHSSLIPSSGSAWRIEQSGGKPQPPEPCPAAGAFGTSVEALDLFCHHPARAKFLKGSAAEAAACADTLLRLALTRPDAAFTLAQDGHEIFRFAPCTEVQSPKSEVQIDAQPETRNPEPGTRNPPLSAFFRRAREALGRKAGAELLEVAFDGMQNAECRMQNGTTTNPEPGTRNPEPISSFPPGYRLYGLLTPPAATRPTRGQIYLAVNGRPVKDRTLTSALLEAYRHLLPPRRYPAAALFLELPGSEVDINVHPTKAEVRFRQPGLIYALLHHAVRSACGVKEIADRGLRIADSTAAPEPGTRNPPARLEPLRRGEGPNPQTRLFDLWPKNAPPDQSAIAHADRAAEAPAPFGEVKSEKLKVKSGGGEIPVSEFQPASPEPGTLNPEPFRVLGQAGGAYIILEDESGVKLIDQHALHERILFEALIARAENQSRADSQGLLIAETLELTPVQSALIASGAEVLNLLAEMGFSIEPFGPRTLAIRAVPAILKTSNGAQLVGAVLESLTGADEHLPNPVRAPKRASLRERAAYVLSCKGAIKAGERLTNDQMSALVAQFRRVAGASGFTCPHGRPLALELSWNDLERAVARK